MQNPHYVLSDAFEGDPDGLCYPALLERVDTLIAESYECITVELIEAIRRHAIRETDPEWAKFNWPDDAALEGMEWAKQIARRAAADIDARATLPHFALSLGDVAIALSPNVMDITRMQRH